MEKKNASRKAQRAARARKQRNRRIALTLCLLLVVCAASIGGTLAWLTASTTPVVNTFTTSDINITLKETKNDFKMVPGNTIAKDPKVTVTTDSEDAWLFVKVTKSDNFDNFMTYEMADNWVLVEGETNVYYYNGTITKGTEISVLKDDQVKVKTDVTKEMMKALTDTTNPTLTFTAYACQQANVADAKTAWSYAKTATAGN